MTEDNDHETRLRDLEAFAAEVRGGRKLLAWIASAIGAGLTLLGVFWDQIFGKS